MIRKLFYFSIVILISFLACSDKPDTSKQNAEIDALQKALSWEKKSEVAQAPDVCFERQSREEKLSCLYERFEYESVICNKLEKLLREKGLIEEIKRDAHYPQFDRAKALIIRLIGPLSNDSNVRYLVTHPAYFEIDVDCENKTIWSVDIAQTCIYCAPTMKRLYELESLGSSDLAWRVRERWLDAYLGRVAFPWYEMGGPEEYFFVEFDRVKQVYNREEDKKRLQQFVDKTEKLFFQTAEIRDIEGAAGQTKEQHLKTLRQWVAQMRKGL